MRGVSDVYFFLRNVKEITRSVYNRNSKVIRVCKDWRAMVESFITRKAVFVFLSYLSIYIHFILIYICFSQNNRDIWITSVQIKCTILKRIRETFINNDSTFILS